MSREALTLGQLIEKLEKLPEDTVVVYGFGYLAPTYFMSWRGSYSELALGYGEVDHDEKKSMTVKKLLKEAKDALTKSFTGWKGGAYNMDEDNIIWVSNGGEACNTVIVDVIDREHKVVLDTAYREF